MTRSFLTAVARGLVGALLTMQLMVSAYACADMSPVGAGVQVPTALALPFERGAANVDLPVAQTSDCDEMAGMADTSLPNLCAEHCKYGQQSDHAPTLNAPTITLIARYAMPLVPAASLLPRPAADTLSALVAASPPHAVLHCVHRL